MHAHEWGLVGMPYDERGKWHRPHIYGHSDGLILSNWRSFGEALGWEYAAMPIAGDGWPDYQGGFQMLLPGPERRFPMGFVLSPYSPPM